MNGVGLEEKISRSLNVVIELQANKSRTHEVITTAKIRNSTAALCDTIWNWSGSAHLNCSTRCCQVKRPLLDLINHK